MNVMMIKRSGVVALFVLLVSQMCAQRAATNPFWDNWFLQFGADMTLQNPYGYDFSKVFPNGKSYGVDVAIGKWFTPEIGMRGKVNWENGLIKNNHVAWLAPFGENGINHHKGGYIATSADLLISLKGLFGSYNNERNWDVSVYPRTGMVYNLGISKGALMLGAGVLTTYRLNSKWKLYADVAYHMVASGFVGKEVEGTGIGSNSNGYLGIDIGAQMSLGRRNLPDHRTESFWSNWFLQAGLDMSLMNPYGCNFSEVFPKGKTFGVNVAVGKQVTPQMSARCRVQWENGIIGSDHLEWVPPVDNPSENHKKGGFGVLNLDVLFDVTNIVNIANVDKRWHTSAFVRAGIISQFAIGSGSPLFGMGLEQTCRLNDGLSLYGDVGYQMTTSESSAGMTGMAVAAGSNGFFDIDLGVKVDL